MWSCDTEALRVAAVDQWSHGSSSAGGEREKKSIGTWLPLLLLKRALLRLARLSPPSLMASFLLTICISMYQINRMVNELEDT